MNEWDASKRATFERDGNALILKVGTECAVNIKNLAHDCGTGLGHFNESAWTNGLAQILGYHLPPLYPGETYKMVIVP